MSGEIDFLVGAIPIFLSIFVPGFLLALALLKKTKLSLAEIAGFGFILGLIIPPTLLFFYSLIGIKFSFEIMILNFIATTILGLILCIKENVFPLNFSFDYRRDYVWVLLLLIMLFAFWVRLQSIGPIFYEFDPYYYDRVTQFILTQGSVPPTDDLAWYPHQDSHRTQPLTNYLEAQWYTIYQGVKGISGFDNYLFATIAGVYPPVVGALLAFLFFILFSEVYGKRYGLLSAILVSIIPRAIEKFAAGESEQQPWGIFAAFFFYAAYVLAMRKGNRRFAILAGIAALGATLGSKSDVLVYLVMAGYTITQSVINFLTKRSNKELVEVNLMILPFVIFSSLVSEYYLTSNFDIPSDVLVTASATLVAIVLFLIDRKVESNRRLDYFIGFSFLSIIVFFISFIPGFPIPIGPRAWGYITGAASVALPSSPLMMTVAEETPTQGDFVSSVGLFGFPLGEVSLMHVILFISALCILYAIYRSSKVALLLGITIFPVSYVGAGIPGIFPGKSKYMLHVSFMVAGAVVIIFGEAEKLLSSLIKESESRELAKKIVFGVAVVALLLEGFLYIGSDSTGLKLMIGGPISDVVMGTFPLISSKYHVPELNCSALAADQKPISYYLYCSQIPDWWLEPMNWIKNNVAENDRVIHWWDYGHWTNYFGQRKTVTRNDHPYQELDLEVADKFVEATPQELGKWMEDHQARYVLFDTDLIGKWGALNFLSCVQNNETNMSFAYSAGKEANILYNLGTSNCEKLHSFERVYIPISGLTSSDYCQSPDPKISLIRAYSSFGYRYCISVGSSGGPIMFYEDDLSKINNGFLYSPNRFTEAGRNWVAYLVLYTYDVGPDGRVSYEDRKGKIYDSNFYRGFFLGNLPGFIQVYPANRMQGPVRIFKLISNTTSPTA